MSESAWFVWTGTRMGNPFFCCYGYGSIANERTGNPDAFSGFGTMLKMTAPLVGSLSKFVNNSIW